MTEYRDPAWIVDIDGTLAHMSDRSPFDYERASEDTPDQVISDLVRMFHDAELSIIICSGREETCRTVTQNWLHQHKIPYTNLFMRAAGDYRPDDVVKLEILDKHILPSFKVIGVLDDRPKVIRAWASRGLKVLDVDPMSGEF